MRCVRKRELSRLEIRGFNVLLRFLREFTKECLSKRNDFHSFMHHNPITKFISYLDNDGSL